jgi:hypothetical protein
MRKNEESLVAQRDCYMQSDPVTGGNTPAVNQAPYRIEGLVTNEQLTA